MATRFFTNTAEKTLLNKFKGVSGSNKDIECFDTLITFLRASGNFSTRPLVEGCTQYPMLSTVDDN